MSRPCGRQNLDTVFLASPTSTDARLKRAAQLSTGFFYLISRTGVTGERSDIASSVQPLAERARRFTALPLAMGFGISTRGAGPRNPVARRCCRGGKRRGACH